MGLNLDTLPDKPKTRESGAGIDLDVLPDKPVKERGLSLNLDILPDKPAPRKDFSSEILPEAINRGLDVAKSVFGNIPVIGGFSPKQIGEGQEALHNVVERPAAGLRAISKEGPRAFVKGLKEPEKYPVGTFAESLVDAGMEPVSAGALGTLADAGYYFGVPEALGRVATAGKVKLLEGTIQNINEALRKAGEMRSNVVDIPIETLKTVAKDNDIGVVANAYIKSKKVRLPRRTNLLTSEEPVAAPSTEEIVVPKDIRTSEIVPSEPKAALPITEKGTEALSTKTVEPITAEQALDKAPADLHEQWYTASDKFTSEIKEPIVKQINELKAQRKSLVRGKDGVQGKKDIDEKIDSLSSQLSEAETRLQYDNIKFQIGIADKAIRMAQDQGLNLGEYTGDALNGVSERWQEFKDDVLTRLYDRPHIETNWKTPVKEIINKTIDDWKGRGDSREDIAKFTDEQGDAILKDYAAKNDIIVSNDTMKKYYSPAGYNGQNSALYQSEAGKLTKRHFDNIVEQNKDTGRYVVFTTGGTGSGKSTAVRAYGKDDNVAAIWDINLADFERNSKLIDETLANGLKVKIAYILRDPEQAFIDGVVARSVNPGSPDYNRVVSVAEHMLVHERVKKVFPALIKKFADKIEYQIIDNRGDIGEEKPMTLADLENIKYNYKEIGKELESYVRSNDKIPQNIQKSMLRRIGEEGTSRGTKERFAIQEGRGQPLQEARPQEVEPASQGTFAASSTGAGFPKASKVPEAIPSAQEHKIEMPELVKLATDLMTKPPVVKKLAKNYGYFKAGRIALDVDIFKNPHFAGSVLAHEIGHLTDWLPDYTLARGNLLGRIATLKKFLKQTFRDLSNKTVREELKALTNWWNPFDPAGNAHYTLYRYSAKELYAEAISVLLNQPEKLEELAPSFYKGFWQNIDKKPDVKEALLELQDFLNLGEGEKLRVRKEDIHGMFKKGEALFYEERNKYKLNQKDLWFKMRTELIDKNTALLDKIKELEKRGITINPEDNPKYYLEEYNYVGGKIKNLLDEITKDIINPLHDIGVSSEDFGEYLFLNRVVTDRADIANPLGHNRITAEKQLNYMKEHFGEEKYAKIKQAAGRFQQIMKELLSRSESSGLIKFDIYGSIVTNESYATFQVLDHIDDYISPAIIKQTGTLKGIANPFTSTIIKMISTLRSIERNNTRLAVVSFMRKNFPAEIEEAKIKRLGKYKAEIEPKDGYGVIQTREHGRLAGYYVDPYIAQTVSKESSVVANGIISVLRFLNAGYFKPVYVNFNLGFQSFNLMRDFIRAWKLNPNVTFPQMLKKYWEAIPIAKRRVWGDFSDPVISQMQENGMLSLTYNDLLRGMSKEEETHIEYLLEKYNVVKKEAAERKGIVGKAINPLIKYLNVIEEIGNFIETLPKVAGYLSRAKSGRNIKEIAHEVRVFSGSPDFLRKGQGYDWYNNVFLFSNAIKEGLRGDVEGAFSNPRTRSGYWWRTAKLNYVPKLVMFLASIGFFGKAIKDNFDKQTEYDKTNYITLPIGETDNGKAVYFRLPQDEVGRLMGGIFWKALNFEREDPLESIKDIGSLAAGQVPSFSPTLELISNWTQYALGKSPYDWFKGRDILSKEEQTAGGWYSLEPMLKWTAGKLGVYSLTVKAKRDDETTFEKVAQNTPIIQRFLRVTDYGSIEKEKEERQEFEQFKAARTLERRR